MREISNTVSRRGYEAAGVFAMLCIALGLALPATAGAAPMRIVVEPALRSGDAVVYALSVRTAGSPVLVILPQSVHLAELVRNGTVLALAGRDVASGAPPFGHGAASFRLAELTLRDRIEIRMYGGSGPPEVFTAVAAAGTAFGSGLASGIFLGLIAAATLSQLLLAFRIRDKAMLFYVGWTLAVFAIELGRDGILPLLGKDQTALTVLVSAVGLLLSVGFIASYLRLARYSRRQWYVLVATNLVAAVTPAFVAAYAHRSIDAMDVYAPNAVAITIGVIIAVISWRKGFKPAIILAVGLLGLLTVCSGQVLLFLTHVESPFFDRWALELGAAFEFLMFAAGLGYRANYLRAEESALTSALQEANFDADHDQLTGLLNRRGLDAWIAKMARPLGTLLFIDVDGFKAVNDEGGHAAGDDTLKVIARIVRNSVRSSDAVARFGGDEFVVFMNESVDSEGVYASILKISAAITAFQPLGAQSATRIGASIGSARVDRESSFSVALQEADGAAYRVKAEHHALNRKAARSVSGATATRLA